MKEKIKSDLNSRYTYEDVDHLLSVLIFLDPHFKLSLFSKVEGKQIQEIIKIELEGLEETCPPAEQLGTDTWSQAQSLRLQH